MTYCVYHPEPGYAQGFIDFFLLKSQFCFSIG
jgi:hypothetical protein